MSFKARLIAAVLGGFGMTGLAIAPASAAESECPNLLAGRYCDWDRDQVADLPVDEKEWVDPSTLIFAYTPVEDPSVYAKVWQGFLDHMGKMTGKRIQFFPVQSNAAQLEAMRSGRLHVAGFNTGSNPIAVQCAGFVPFAMMAAKDGSFGYEMEIIVQADGPIQSVADLKGKKVAFTAPTSNSGFKAPSALLKSEFGLEAEKDFTAEFSGKHDNSVLGVANKDYDAAAIANSVMKRMFDRGVVDSSKIRTIYKSDTFPTTGYGHAHNLHPELAAKVKLAFFTFPWEGSELDKEFKAEDGFIGIRHKNDWSIVRKIDAAMGVEYECK